MTESCYLCVDCGTTVIKATLLDDRLAILDEAKRPVTVYCPFPCASETDMPETWALLCEIAQELRARDPARWARLRGVGVTGQGDGLWPVDEAGQPVGRAMLWNDTRARDIDFEAMPGVRETIASRHTNLIYAGSMLALLVWLKRNRPQDYARVHRALHCKDWLNYKLTGVLGSDPSDASSCAYDNEACAFVPELFALAGIPEAASMLPTLRESTDILGAVTPEAEAASGIPAGIPVIAGAIDVCAVALGSDVRMPGRSCAIIGTTLSSQIALAKSQVDFAEKRGLLVRHVLPDLYIRLLPTLSGASTMDFAKALLYPDTSYRALEERLDRLPIGSDGLICHPYICGERAPFKNPFATGGFFGLTQQHTRDHLMRSVFEGLACSCYDCYQALEGRYESVYLTGGASVSRVVCQMFADMLGVPCRRIEGKELGTLGVARLLLLSLGVWPNASDYPDQPATAFTPDPIRHERYLALYEVFKSLQTQMAGFWRARCALLNITEERNHG